MLFSLNYLGRSDPFGGTVSSWEEVFQSKALEHLYDICANLMLRKARDWTALAAVKEHFNVRERRNLPRGAFELEYQVGALISLTVARNKGGLLEGLRQLLFMVTLLKAVPSEVVLHHLDSCPGCGQSDLGLEPGKHFLVFKVQSPTQPVEMGCCLVFNEKEFSLWKLDLTNPLWDSLSERDL